jgi:hypothetical protein
VSTDTDAAEKLLAAASQTPERAMRVIYCAEARIYIDRERQRLKQQQELLDAIEAELTREGAGYK